VTADKLVDAADVPTLRPRALELAQRLQQHQQQQMGGAQQGGGEESWAAQLSRGIVVNAADRPATAAQAAGAAAGAFDLHGAAAGLPSEDWGADAESRLGMPVPDLVLPGMAWSSSLGMEALRSTASFAASLVEQLK